MILWINMNADIWGLVCVSPMEKEGLRHRAGNCHTRVPCAFSVQDSNA